MFGTVEHAGSNTEKSDASSFTGAKKGDASDA
jgi:hypothetical protein